MYDEVGDWGLQTAESKSILQLNATRTSSESREGLWRSRIHEVSSHIIHRIQLHLNRYSCNLTVSGCLANSKLAWSLRHCGISLYDEIIGIFYRLHMWVAMSIPHREREMANSGQILDRQVLTIKMGAEYLGRTLGRCHIGRC